MFTPLEYNSLPLVYVNTKDTSLEDIQNFLSQLKDNVNKRRMEKKISGINSGKLLFLQLSSCRPPATYYNPRELDLWVK
jgi:hypothetical protein